MWPKKAAVKGAVLPPYTGISPTARAGFAHGKDRAVYENRPRNPQPWGGKRRNTSSREEGEEEKLELSHEGTKRQKTLGRSCSCCRWLITISPQMIRKDRKGGRGFPASCRDEERGCCLRGWPCIRVLLQPGKPRLSSPPCCLQSDKKCTLYGRNRQYKELLRLIF